MQLTRFNEIDFLPALKEFFGKSNLNIPINYVDDKPVSAKKILQNTYKDNEVFRLINDVYFVGLVDDAAFRGNQSLAIDQIKSDYDGILIFGVTLNNRDHGQLPKRSHLAEISRSFNQEFYYTPVVVVFKYTDANSEYLAFANTERLKYKDNREGEKAGKVTLLRDIDIRQPHSGHERILAELAIPKTGKDRVDSFANLYAYWQKVLDVSLLNKNFYRELSNWYFWAVGRVTFPSEPNLLEAQAKKVSLEDLKQEHKSKNVIRLLTRLLFVWFIKEKGLIPPELFNLDDLQRDILKNISPYTDLGLFKQVNQESIYYKAILQNLFFATLNCPIKPMESHDNRVRGFRKMDNYGQHRDANFLMRYREHFQNPERFVEMVNGVVPFLNGGLFECLDDKLNKVFIDGFSDNLPKTEQLIVPDYLFFGAEEKVDLSAEYGATNKGTKEAAVKGLINILKAYKFTITENTPIEEDVALDPELLGKVFENLLASYNPETKTTARKQTGSFYTPREIVNYMVDESLIAYLKNELLAQESGYKEEDLDRQLRQLVSFDAVNPFEGNAEVQKRIIKALDKCTILDPACGSGAFPMGILQKMVHILFKVDPKNTEWKHRQIARVEAAISQLEELDDAQYREQGIQDLNAQIKDIEEAFANNELDYGRKLYLIENCIYGVDIQSIATQISKLRFFISLVVDQGVDPNKDNFGIRPLPNLETKFVAANTLIGIEKPKVQLSLFDTPEIKKLEADLKKVRHRLFSSKSPSHKRKLRDQDKALREKIAGVLQKNGWETDTANKLANWDPYNQNVSSPFFDPEWMFDIIDGFDIVIGNPPYGNIFKDKKMFNQILKLYFTAEYKIEAYSVFVEKGTNLLSNDGILNFITPYTFLSGIYFSKLRQFIKNNCLKKLTVLGKKVFEAAEVDTCIIFIQKNTSHRFCSLLDLRKNNYLESLNNIPPTNIPLDVLLSSFQEVICVGSKYEIEIFQKLNRQILKIDDLIEFYHGIQTRGNNDSIFEDQIDGTYPIIKGRDFNKFYLGRIEQYFILKSENIKSGGDLSYHYTNPKLIIRTTADGIIATIDRNKNLVLNSVNIGILKSKNSYSLEAILGIINSKLIDFWYSMAVQELDKTFAEVKIVYLKRIPIPNYTETNNKLIATIVEVILFSNFQKRGFYKQLDDILDSLVFNVYFPEHMKNCGINVLDFIERDIAEFMQGKEFKNLLDEEKQKVIEQLYAKWTDTENEVPNRIKLFAVRSPDILKPILESK
jgi:tRNA1(Val) A37 N6-methylase TrmN6